MSAIDEKALDAAARALVEHGGTDPTDADGPFEQFVSVMTPPVRSAITAYLSATKDAQEERVARAICAEKCAFMGEPPCWTFKEETWPPPTCDEPGCVYEARAAIKAMER